MKATIVSLALTLTALAVAILLPGFWSLLGLPLILAALTVAPPGGRR